MSSVRLTNEHSYNHNLTSVAEGDRHSALGCLCSGLMPSTSCFFHSSTSGGCGESCLQEEHQRQYEGYQRQWADLEKPST